MHRHNIEVRPIDVCYSDWDCTLEPLADGQLALRLGLRLIKGLSQTGALRVVAARRQKQFTSVPMLTCQARLNKHDLDALVAANALSELAGHRHQAHWQALAADTLPLFQDLEEDEPAPILPLPTEGAEIVADYASIGLTLGRHPLALLRNRLTALHAIPAAQLKACRPGDFVHIIALVHYPSASRQRQRHGIFDAGR